METNDDISKLFIVNEQYCTKCGIELREDELNDELCEDCNYEKEDDDE